MFKLFVSYDCGINYDLVQESEKIEDFDSKIKEFDENWLRWYIEDEKSELKNVSKIHKEIITSLSVISEMNRKCKKE